MADPTTAFATSAPDGPLHVRADRPIDVHFSFEHRQSRVGAGASVGAHVVLLTVFVWTYLWGIAGAFIGIPILIAALTLCAESPNARWVAALLSGRREGPG